MLARLAGVGGAAAVCAAAARARAALLTALRHPAVRLGRAAAARVATVRLLSAQSPATHWGGVQISLFGGLVRSSPKP